jgi:hypothetical protein
MSAANYYTIIFQNSINGPPVLGKQSPDVLNIVDMGGIGPYIIPVEKIL